MTDGVPPLSGEEDASEARNSRSQAQDLHTGGSARGIPLGLSVQGGGVRGACIGTSASTPACLLLFRNICSSIYVR